uniref:Uncharacterized protein n=2 Tax=Canis lupus dingo TaxID=286419 RepID=A0A8C0LP62_CANLU
MASAASFPAATLHQPSLPSPALGPADLSLSSCPLPVAGAMSTPSSSPLAFLTAPVTPGSSAEAVDPLPMLITLACIFLLLASCLLFMTLCKPAALDPIHRRAGECMPHHPGSPSEPQLRLWKRLGSLRRSLHSFHRGRPVPRRPLPGCDDNHDCDCPESTKM